MNGKTLAWFLGLLLPVGVARAQMADVGWRELPNTKIRSVCPENGFGGSGFDFAIRCQAVTTAWSGGALDESRNRLIIWGGGTSDYPGNELYALNLDTPKMERLTDPGLPLPVDCTDDAIPGGTQPRSRHTYDGIAYLKKEDRLFVVGGADSCGSLNTAWTFDFKTSKWEVMNPSGPQPLAMPGIATAYDPNTGKVLIHDQEALYTYDFKSNSYERILNLHFIDYHMTGAYDFKRKRLILLGGDQEWVIDLSGDTAVQKSLGSTGGAPVIGTIGPGLAYDPSEDKMVAWIGGNTVYTLDLDTRVWTSKSYDNGPGAALPNGTYGRWEFVPTMHSFVVVNGVDANAFLIRLSPPSALGSPGSPARGRYFPWVGSSLARDAIGRRVQGPRVAFPSAKP